jgi:hypothetical protein
MGDGLAAAVGAGEVFGGNGCGRGFWGRIAADKAGALGKAAGVAKHGANPECPGQFIAASSSDRPILVSFATSSRPSRKKVFL